MRAMQIVELGKPLQMNEVGKTHPRCGRSAAAYPHLWSELW